MSLSRRTVFAAVALVGISGAAFAQTAPQVTRVRGTIDKVDSSAVQVTTRSGEHLTLKLAPDARYTFIAPISITAIKPGSFIGTAAVTQPDGTLKALEVQVFPESMRGVGEGHRPWDLGSGSTMTNGTVGDLKVSNGRVLTLTYKGGEQKVVVPEKVPVITYEPATAAAMTKGAHIIAFVTKADDGSLTAVRVGVGKNGLVPPM
jgi:hypothetical protein